MYPLGEDERFFAPEYRATGWAVKDRLWGGSHSSTQLAPRRSKAVKEWIADAILAAAHAAEPLAVRDRMASFTLNQGDRVVLELPEATRTTTRRHAILLGVFEVASWHFLFW
jgi:hypothetical protein